MNIYEKGSTVITFLVQYLLNDPNMYVWPEIDTGGLLDMYLETPTSDECVVNTINQYVKEYLKDDLSGKFSPDNASGYFRQYLPTIAEVQRGITDNDFILRHVAASTLLR